MVSTILILVAFLLSGSVWAQDASTDKAEATIERVKVIHVSSLDRDLPDVTLEFFLEYEAEGAPIRWRMSDCIQPKSSSGDREVEPGICVEAQIDLKHNRSATVAVLMGTAKTTSVAVPKVFRVTVTDQNGATHTVRRLRDLPIELHRPSPKSPRDLPLPSGAPA